MNWTPEQVAMHNDRVRRGKGIAITLDAPTNTATALLTKYHGETVPASFKAVEREGDLHDQIQAYCDAQWPKLVTIHSRMDRPTTNEKGVADFIIFCQYPKVVVIEAKAKNKKQSIDQLAWAKRMEAVGWKTHVVHSFQEFKSVIETHNPETI